jgi:Delta7-sterol 5-desaturase
MDGSDSGRLLAGAIARIASTGDSSTSDLDDVAPLHATSSTASGGNLLRGSAGLRVVTSPSKTSSSSVGLPSSASPNKAVYAKRTRSVPRSLGVNVLAAGLASGRAGLMQTLQALGWLVGAALFAVGTLAMYGHFLPAYLLMTSYYVVGVPEPMLTASFADVVGLVVGNVVGGLVSYHLICYPLYRYYYVQRASPEQRKQWKVHAESLPTRETVADEIKLSHVACIVSTAGSGLQLAYLTSGGASRLFFSASSVSVLYLVGSCAGAFLLQDFCMYATHRCLHDIPWLMKRVHMVHHRFHHPTPYAVLAMHWVEAVLLETAVIIPLFFFPVWAPYFYFSLVYTLVSGVAGHSGVDLPALMPWQAPSWFHDHHHVYVTGNYGSSLLLWDYLLGTYRPRDNTQENLIVGRLDDVAHATDHFARPPAKAAQPAMPGPARGLYNWVTSAYRRLAHRRS